jgi:hypothetical protein
MNNPLGTADFFALEAGECLDRLEQLVAGASPPAPDEFLRMARVLRGSALMAGQAPIAKAAASLEALARIHRDHAKSWDPAAREQVGQAIDEFRLLIRRSREWSDGDTERAARLSRGLDNLAGQQGALVETGSPSSVDRKELHTGVRAFVAREGALIASALDRAARSLRAAPGDRESLYNVIRRMQSLRGLAELGELPPLPDILDAIELAVGDLTRLFAPPPGVDEVMDAAGQALTRISRDVADRGRPDPNAPEALRFTELLLRAFAVERDVVAIDTLYYTDDPQPFSHPATQPQFTPPDALGPLELVSHGEHLCQSADLIQGATSAIQRDLRLYRLLGTLRSATAPSADPVAGALGIFARSAQEALASGVATRSVADLVSRLREAGELLRAVVESDDRMLISRRLLDVAHRLDGLRAAAESEPIVPIESLAYEAELDVVPIESLAPSPSPSAAGSPSGAVPDSPTGLEISLGTLNRLAREHAAPTPSFTALLAGSGTPSKPETVVTEEAPVPIGTLCYRGHAALERANAIRLQIAAELDRDATLQSIQPLLQELLDLVPLALVES